MQIKSDLTNLLEVIPDAVVLVDKSGVIKYANRTTERLFSYTSDELLEESIAVLIPKNPFSNSRSTSEQPLPANTADRGCKCEALRRDGSKFPIQLVVTSFNQGGIELFIAIITDRSAISEREERLQLNDERSLLAQRFAQIGYWDWSIQSGDLYWSEQIAPMFGYRIGELETSYENFVNAIHPDDREKVQSAVGASVEKDAKYEIEHRVVWPDKTIRWLLERGGVIRADDGTPLRMLGVVQDITERKALETELIKEKIRAEQGARVKSTFLANMSHEIRTPMNSVIGFIELALESNSLGDELRSFLTTAHRSAHGLLGIINDILDVSKLEEGMVKLQKSEIYLPTFLKDTLQILNYKAEEKGLNLTLELEPYLYRCIISDPIRIRQILINLIGNAIKFTEQGSVTLTVNRCEPKMLRFEVVDTGIGMTREQLNRIFNPFTQADESTARRFGGTGLGTTISKQLVELLGGTIDLESEPGSGTTVSFTISHEESLCAKNCESSCGKHFEISAGVALHLNRSYKILVVEDISENATLLAIRLKQQGSTVTIASDGIEALEKLQNGEFDFILMDVQMPRMDGLIATQKIRELEKEGGGRIPIIALTASMLPDEINRFIKGGMDAVVSKPVDFDELFATIEKIVPADCGLPLESTPINLGKEMKVDWPSYTDGIDLDRARRIWNHDEHYARALHDFARSKRDIARKFKTEIEAGEISAAYRTIHSLVGVAGNLAMTNVTRLARELNNRIKADEIEPVRERVDELIRALDKVLLVIDNIKMDSESGKLPGLPYEHERVTFLLSEIRQNFSRGDSNDVLLQELIRRLEGNVPGYILRKITICTDNFDFKKANLYLGEIADSLQNSELEK